MPTSFSGDSLTPASMSRIMFSNFSDHPDSKCVRLIEVSRACTIQRAFKRLSNGKAVNFNDLPFEKRQEK
jgi:hypothetical protein